VNTIDALGGVVWFNVYAGLFLAFHFFIAISLTIIAFRI